METALPRDRNDTASITWRRILALPEIGTLIPLVCFILIFQALNPVFLNADNVTSMLRAMSFVGIIAVGQVFLMIAGEIDLSVGATAGLGAIVAAYMMASLHLPVILSFSIGLLAGLLVGLVNGIMVVKIRIPAFIAALAMLNIARGVTYLISKGYSIYPLPKVIERFGTAQPLHISWSFIIFIFLVIIGDVVLRQTFIGSRVLATGGNKQAARAVGINTDRVKMLAFVLVGALSSIGGMLLMARLITGQPTIGQGWELNVIAGAVIGGVSLFGGIGTVTGAAIGLIIMQVVTNGLVIVGVDPYWQTVAVGLIMLVAVGVDMLRRRPR